MNRSVQFNSRVSRRKRPLRELVESFILLALAVLLFRSFVAEGYLISTGSMAPTLLGYHRRVECPACQFAFHRGAAFDSVEGGVSIAAANLDADLDVYSATQCPNCSLEQINARTAPRNEGDQLLVQKLSYQFRDPRRWEVVVFQNRNDPSQAYVKRVTGLPGEQIEIRDGDLYANGELQRKPFDVQQAVRVAVSDYSHRPTDADPDWRQRWSTPLAESQWKLFDENVSFADEKSSSSGMDWLLYEHWIRNGGAHLTNVPLATWPSDVAVPEEKHFRYESGHLICMGTFSAFEKQRWSQKTDDVQFHNALNQLYEQSHVAPVVDAYGYNSYENRDLYPLHDLMLSFEVTRLSGSGQLEAQLTDGADVFRLVIRPDSHEIALFRNRETTPLWVTRISLPVSDESIGLDFSMFDQQVVVAINGEPVQQPFTYTAKKNRPALRRPTRIGASGITCELSSLILYRDLYYTPKNDDLEQHFKLNEDEFFVLGDNSPVSVDSRLWESPAVPRHALIGKPFVVHLPSRQGRFHWKGETRYVRVPDFSRIRYIR